MDTHELLAILDSLLRLPEVRLEPAAGKPDYVTLRMVPRHRELLYELNKDATIRSLLQFINTDPIFLIGDQNSPVPRDAAETFVEKHRSLLNTLSVIRELLRNTVQEEGGLLVRLPPTPNLGELEATISALRDILDYPLKLAGADQVHVRGAEAGSTILVLTLAGKAIGIVSAILYIFFHFIERLLKLKHAASELESHEALKGAAVDAVKSGLAGLEKEVEGRVEVLLRAEATGLDEGSRNEARVRISTVIRGQFQDLIDRGMEIYLSANASDPLKSAFPTPISLEALKQRIPQLKTTPNVAAALQEHSQPPKGDTLS